MNYLKTLGRPIIFDRKYIKPGDAPTENIREVVDVVGLEVVLKTTEIYGGEYLYYPKYEKWCVGERNRRIKREFDGMNYKALAKKYGVSNVYCREMCIVEK